MLSYRFNSLEDADWSSVSYLRSSLSATRLITIIGTDFGRGLSNFPFVPYSISLALRVAYRELRFCKTAPHRVVARSLLLTICSLLEKYSDGFSFARRMVTLAAKTVQEMDKVAASILQGRDNKNHGAPGTDNRRDEVRPSQVFSHVTATNDNGPPAGEMDNRTTETDRSHVPQPLAYNPSQYTVESFDHVRSVPDLPDLFDHFDPDFNLDAIDFALVQNGPPTAVAGYGTSLDVDWISTPGQFTALPASVHSNMSYSGPMWQ